MNPTFTKFHQNRLEWAFQAKKEFIDHFVRLDVEISESTYSKELLISVYGPTQVGKTTVILYLLGIKQDKLEQLSTWLRGRKKLGESSTVTVMRYERSQDEYFHLRLPNHYERVGLTGEQLEAELHSLRFNVEQEGAYSVEPVTVEIPFYFFEERDVHINIVDLPGIESAELKEVEHVKQCIKHWLPLSEVCLLVDDATQLTAFTQYTLKGIKNWYEQLSNFRVIPTRALSLDNIRRKIQNCLIVSADDLIADYAKVLNRVLKMDLDLSKTIYPIDLGNSWNVIREKEPFLYEKMKYIIAEILENLQEDLENVEVNELSFNRLMGLYKEAEEASKQELEQQQDKIDKYKKFIERQTFMFEQEQEADVQQYEHIRKELDLYQDFMNRIRFQDVNPDAIMHRIHQNIRYTDSDRKASAINEAASKLQLGLEKELDAKLRAIKQEASILKISGTHQLELPYLYPIPKVEKMFDAYRFEKTYKKAFYETTDYAFDWVNVMYQNFNHLIKPIYNKVKNQVELLEKQVLDLKFVSEERKKKREKLFVMYQEEKGRFESHYQEILEMWNQDREHATQLQSYFIKHWMNYKAELQYHFLYGDEKERWLASQYLQLLLQDGKKIIESLN